MKKIGSILLTIALVVSMCLSAVVTASAAEATPAVWDGTANIKWYFDGKAMGEYEIKTAEELAGLAWLVGASNPDSVYNGVYYDANYKVLGWKASGNGSSYVNANHVYTPTAGDGSQLVDGENFLFQEVKLTADIVLNQGNAADWATTAPANEWLPIGGDLHSDPSHRGFDGTFNGQGHTVSGLYYVGSEEDGMLGAGLFGYVGRDNPATIQNLTVSNFYIEGSQSVGAIVGHSRKGVYLENCLAKDGFVTAKVTQAGGLCGGVFAVCEIASSGVDNVKIVTKDRGGMVGAINNITMKVTDCYITNSALELNGTYAAIIVGFSSNSSIQVSNVYSTLKITVNPIQPEEGSEATEGTEPTPQEVGVIFGAYNADYSAPNVTASGVYYVADLGEGVSGTDTEGVTAITLADITGESAKNTLVGFDFDTVWKTVENSTPIIELREASNEGGGETEEPGNTETEEPGNTETKEPGNDETEAPDNTETKAPETSDNNTEEPKKGGCGSSVGVVGIALAAVLSGAAMMLRKKEN